MPTKKSHLPVFHMQTCTYRYAPNIHNTTRHEYKLKINHRTYSLTIERMTKANIFLCLIIQSHCPFMKVGYFCNGHSKTLTNEMTKFIEKIRIDIEQIHFAASNWALYDYDEISGFHNPVMKNMDVRERYHMRDSDFFSCCNNIMAYLISFIWFLWQQLFIAGMQKWIYRLLVFAEENVFDILYNAHKFVKLHKFYNATLDWNNIYYSSNEISRDISKWRRVSTAGHWKCFI